MYLTADAPKECVTIYLCKSSLSCQGQNMTDYKLPWCRRMDQISPFFLTFGGCMNLA